MNLMKLVEMFDSETACHDYLAALRWPNGVACGLCGSTAVTELPKRHQYQCSSCRYQFSVTAGTIMHDSKLPLRKWMLAIYLIVESKKGISSLQLTRTLKVAPKTGWYLSQRIRTALRMENPAPLAGTVEADETYIGGRVRGRGKGYVDNKALVMGARERGGAVRMEQGPDKTAETIRGFIKRTVSPDAEAIYTDDSNSYGDLSDHNTRHETVAHKQEEWVRGDVHTNSIEGEWSLFKRGVVGAFHHVSEKHLHRYLDEFSFRANNRDNVHIYRDALRELLTAGNLEYKHLIA
jgi:transposase-like protein